MLFACILQVWGNDLTLSVVSGDCYLLEFYRPGAIPRSCQWSPVLVICLYFAGLEQSFNPVGGVRRLVLACILQLWSNYSTLSVESGDCYSLVFCTSGAIN